MAYGRYKDAVDQALMIENIAYVQQSRKEMVVVFALLAEHWKRGSVLLRTNLPCSNGEAIFRDPMTTAAASDRLAHHSVSFDLNLPSYRPEEAQQTKRGQAAGRSAAVGVTGPSRPSPACRIRNPPQSRQRTSCTSCFHRQREI